VFRPFFTMIAVVTMFFNGGLIPNYILTSNVLGLRDSMLSIILPNAINVFYMLIMKSFFENLPVQLDEAAMIDGLGTFGIFRRIALPLSKALMATMILFYSVWFWNSWFSAFLYLDDKDLHPVSIYLRNMIAGSTTAASLGASSEDVSQVASNIQAVTVVLTLVPILLVYPFVQKYFVKGVMIGAVKG
jgi:putative aldouronate transport system permease protein